MQVGIPGIFTIESAGGGILKQGNSFQLFFEFVDYGQHIFTPYLYYEIMILKDIGKNIKQLRRQKQMAQIDLAVAVGIDWSYLSGIENGKRNPTILLLDNIA